MQHFDDDSRSELKRVMALIEVNKYVYALSSIKLFHCIILGIFCKSNKRVSTIRQILY